MQSKQELPQGYAEILHIDLQKDKKAALRVNGLALLITAVCIAVGLCIVPFAAFYKVGSYAAFAVKLAVLGGGSVLYIIAHEWVHGIFMKRYSGIKVHYGYTGLYAYAGSDAYFCRAHYIRIALAPIVIWGIVLLALNLLLPAGWFWPVYMIQVSNLSGAAGDIYVSCRMYRLPQDILIRDTGISMTVYGKV